MRNIKILYIIINQWKSRKTFLKILPKLRDTFRCI